LKLKSDEIQSEINKLNEISGAIHKEIIDICFYMRGGITIDQAYKLTIQQREMIAKRIKKNIEQTEKSGLALM